MKLTIVILFAMVCSTLMPLRMLAQDDQTPSEIPASPLQEPVSDRILPTARLIQPAGESTYFNGRPVDLEVFESWVLVKDRNALRVIDQATMKVVQTIASPGGASLHGLAVAKSGNVYFTNANRNLHVYSFKKGVKQAPYVLNRSIELPSGCFPCGVYVNEDETRAVVCLSKRNSVAVVDLSKPEASVISEVQVGVAPFDVVANPQSSKQFWVSCIGGRLPRQGDTTAPSAKTETVVDKRGIASTGLVSLIDIDAKPPRVIREVAVGRHPTTIQVADDSVLVCNTNEDTVTTFSGKNEEQAPQVESVRPLAELPFGSMPSDLLRLENGIQLVALAGNNALLVRKNAEILGAVPTGWYPVALASTRDHLFIANVKGRGSRASVRDREKGRNSHDHLGSIQKVPLSQILDRQQRATWTDQVRANSRFPQILKAMELSESPRAVAPVPIPKKLGQPSLFKHVIYVIKENRTFDQVFGDLTQEGVRAEPKLCVFPKAITPNHHALAQRFGILDNYYCNGVLSADGHSWATEANVTPYLERAFGGFSRSYTFGDDPITYSSSGFIWDRFLDNGFSFRNYGEMNYSTPPQGMKFQEIWKAYTNGQPIQFEQNIGIERLRTFSCRRYPGWNMVIPDVLRMDRFLEEFKAFEANGGLPNLSIVYLPQDHLGGGVTSRAHMADNDQAIGRLVQAVSNSEYWKDTVIFINEDDPQNGYDHIDGHRSLCLVVSAYSKSGVQHQFYNQSSVIRTILHIFGLSPLNQQDASSPLMNDCFQQVGDFAPYRLLPTTIPLNETSVPKDQQGSLERKWRERLATVPIQRTGMKTEVHEDILNRFIWHEMKGWSTPYPLEWAGAHGRGLKKLRLTLSPEDAD